LYKNSHYGYSLQYLSNWYKHESTITPEEENKTIAVASVSITSPDNVASLLVFLHNVTQYLDTNDLKVKNKTAHDYALEEIQKFPIYFMSSPPRYVKVKSVMLINNTTQRWELHYITTGFNSTAYYNIDYFMIKDHRVYMFQFSCKPLQVPMYLPIAQRMIDSFQITKRLAI
jgi:hypothetical protein